MVYGNNTQNCILWIHLKLIMVPYFSKFATKLWFLSSMRLCFQNDLLWLKGEWQRDEMCNSSFCKQTKLLRALKDRRRRPYYACLREGVVWWNRILVYKDISHFEVYILVLVRSRTTIIITICLSAVEIYLIDRIIT